MANLSELRVYSLEDLETNLGSSRFPKFVEDSERAFQDQVAKVLRHAVENEDIRLIFISGPTSSGKTTFTNRLRDQLKAYDRCSHLCSMDDYYYETAISYDSEGRPDFESVETLELDLLHEHLAALAKGEEIIQPLFDFVQRRRVIDAKRRLKLVERDILLVEGLHALSEKLLYGIPEETMIKVFIMPYAQFVHDKRTLSPSDIRKLRRVSRDVSQRGSTALSTLDYWPAIEREEERFIKPYLERADYYINTSLAYEFVVIPPYSNAALKISLSDYMAGTLPPSDNIRDGLFYADLNRAIQDARRLSRVCELLPQVDSSVVPEDSILQEFI